MKSNVTSISLILFFFAIIFFSSSAFNTLDDYEEKLVTKKLNSFDESLKNESIDKIIEKVGLSFLGTEYVAGTLDENAKSEKLVIKISGLDCVTFVENTLAISRTIQTGMPTLESFKDELQSIRYRDGKIDGYTSRLHYFSDWIYDNEKKGIVKDITKKIGGVPYKKTINFMTTHSDSYKQLKNNPDAISLIEDIESKINSRKMYYIPKNEVDSYYDDLKTGDIIATTTKIEGLDVTHTGYIYKKKGKTYFLHASLNAKEVIISKEELKTYLKSDKKKTGIMIARPYGVN
ncbi:MAG: N-acetylmuramoyl-L-alanine amidase-like domain-containing protein [Ignavibacteria bacterium]|jgi:pterin-4a-carbinolamine dehydratase